MKFTKNIELDAVFVHAATIGLFALCAMQLGFTIDEADKRAKWLKKQDEEYIHAVCVRVVELENKAKVVNDARRPENRRPHATSKCRD